jgi:hypothetical protein
VAAEACDHLAAMKRNSYPDGVDPDDAGSVMRALMSGAFDAATDQNAELQAAGRVAALSSLLAAIAETMPRPSVMFIEGTTIADEVKNDLGDRSVEPGRDDLWGTVWPRSDGFHVPVTDENLRDLLAVAQRKTRQAICDHITVYHGAQVLLAAHDVGGEVWVSGELPADTIEQFRRVANAA